jgi:hypothetical protein
LGASQGNRKTVSMKNNDLRNQIYNSMNLKETDELIEIWQRHNSNEWSDFAFEVVEEILRDRLGELPPQGKLNVKNNKSKVAKNLLSKKNYKKELSRQAKSYAIVYGPAVIAAIFLLFTATKDSLFSHIVIFLLSLILSSILIIIRREVPRLPPFESIKGRKATTMGYGYLVFFLALLMFYIIVNVFNL